MRIASVGHDDTVEAAPWAAAGDPRLDLPSWVADLERTQWSLSSADEPSADLRGARLATAAARAFDRAFAARKGHPARVWVFLPRITDPDDDGLDRYMRMNVARADSYRRHLGETATPPAGTGVGHSGDRLVVHVLWHSEPCTGIENPRQVPAWQYSRRFGPASPPFSRAVRAGGLIVASGTASVVGEDTRHPGDAQAQWNETMANLEALRLSAGARPWHALRVYAGDAAALACARAMAARELAGRDHAVLLAPLCRRELLVEVEAVAHA